MATAEAVQKHLTCSICLEVFKVPKTLSCLHTFCESCLDSHIRGSIDSDKSFHCPICRTKTFPEKPASGGSWAKSFPTNHFIVSLLDDDTHHSHKISEVEQDSMKECLPCKLDDKNIKAFCFCIQCVEYLCKNCNESHRRVRSTRNHTVLKGNKLPTDISAFDKLSKIRFCNIHTDKEIEFKCVKHNVYMCSLCAITQHKNCEPVEHGRRIYGQNTLKSNNDLDEIVTLKTDVEKALECRLKKADDLDNESKRIVKQSSEIIEQLKALIDHLENRFLTQYKEHVQFEQRKLAMSVTECLAITDTLNKMSEVTNLALKYGSQIQKALVYNQLSDRVVKVNNCIKAQEGNCPDFLNKYLKYEVKALKQTIKEHVYETLETICTTETTQLADSASALLSTNDDLMDENSIDSSNLNADEKSEEVSTNAPALAPVTKSTYVNETLSLLKQSVRKVGEHDISVSQYAIICSHNGSLLLDNGNMVLIDRNNQVAKMISPDFKLVCHTSFDEKPVDICLLGKNKVAVAMANGICVVSVKSQKDFRQREYFKMKYEVRSVCSVGNKLAILCVRDFDGDQQFFIEMRDNKHNLIETTDYLNARTSIPHTGNLKHAKVIRSRYPDEIIVCEPRRVRSIDLDGHQNWYFVPAYLRHANYIAFDSKRNVYICDLESGTISQMSEYSYKESRKIINDVCLPTSILYNPKDQTLVVGCMDDNNVHVYKFI